MKTASDSNKKNKRKFPLLKYALVLTVLVAAILYLIKNGLTINNTENRDKTSGKNLSDLTPTLENKKLALGGLVLFRNVEGKTPFLADESKSIIVDTAPDRFEDKCYKLENILDFGESGVSLKPDMKDKLPLDVKDRKIIQSYLSDCSNQIIENKRYYMLDIPENEVLVIEKKDGQKIGLEIKNKKLISANRLNILEESNNDSRNYPSGNSKQFRNYVLLHYYNNQGGNLLVINNENDRLAYSKYFSNEEYSLISGTFSLITGDNDIVGLLAGWEGDSWALGLLDLSQSEPRFVNLVNIKGDKVPYYTDTFPHFKWINGGVQVYKYKFIDPKPLVGDLVKDVGKYEKWSRLPEAEASKLIEPENKRLENIIRDKGYSTAKCEVGLGLGYGCYVSEEPIVYLLRPGGNLIKIN